MKKTILLILVFTLSIITEQTKADFIFGEPQNMGPVINTASSDGMCCISTDGLELYFASDRPGGQGNFDIWVSKRLNIQAPWEPPTNLGIPVNSQYNEVYPSLSADGLRLYFSDYLNGFGASDRTGGMGGHDIWMSIRTSRTAQWTTPVNMGGPINTPQHEMSPMIAGNDLVLFFASSRAGGPTYDLWMSTRTDVQAPWNSPIRLEGNINTETDQYRCSLAPDGFVLFFDSGRSTSFGSSDLWMSLRKNPQDPWDQVINLGSIINSGSDNLMGTISADMKMLYFYSIRSGGGGYDLWQTQIDPIVDFNADGIVNSTDICIMVDHWNTDEPLCDIGPMPWGDGIVDVQDMTILAERLFEEVPLPVELVAYWKLDEENGEIAYDSAGDNVGLLFGNPVWRPNEGKRNGSLEFDGSDDYINIPFLLNPADGEFTVCAWIKGGATGQVIVSQSDGTGFGSTWLGLDAKSGKLLSNLCFFELASETIISDDQWHHVGLVWNGSRRSLYLDGQKDASDESDLVALSASGDLHIGTGKAMEPGTYFSGLIDDVRIYNIALSADEVAALAR